MALRGHNADLLFPTSIPQPQDRIRTILAPNLSHGGVPSGLTRRTGHRNTACAKNSKSHLRSGIHPLHYTRSGREGGKFIVSAARTPPMRTDTPRVTGAAGEQPPPRQHNSKQS